MQRCAQLAILIGLAATRALAGEPAALVLDVTGDTEPAVFPYSEIEAGTEVTLADDATLSLIHYGTCKALTLIGGSVRIEANRYLIGRSRVEEERAQDCPNEVALAEDGTAAGVLMRGGDALHLPLRPSFVLAGGRADTVERIDILSGAEPVMTLPVKARHVAWPEDAAALKSGSEYGVSIVHSDGSSSEYAFLANARGPRSLVILRLD
jgi:hypothetical protein